MTAVICAVFATLFQKDVREYGAWLMVGLCFWNFITLIGLFPDCANIEVKGDIIKVPEAAPVKQAMK